MDITDSYWLRHGQSDVTYNNVGKWMLFYPKSKINEKWSELCKLWDNKKLKGVVSMKCSTALENSRASSVNEGVIILYCNDSDNKDSIIKIGNTIRLYINDYPNDAIYYKTDYQTSIGTKATGATKNYLYKIDIDRPLFMDD